MKTMKLSKCTDILVRGVNVIKDEDEGIDYYEIKLKNIVENRISISEKDIHGNGRNTQIQSKRLKYGDIIFPVRGTFSKAILYDLDLDLPCIVSHHFWIVRANKNIISPHYLLFFLLSIKDKINNNDRNILGSKKREANKSPALLSITNVMLKDIDVPIVDKEEQAEAEEVYSFSQKLHQYTNQLNKFNNNIGSNFIKSPSHYSIESLHSTMKDIENIMSTIESL